MTNDLWLRFRRLFARQSPPQSVEHIVAGYRAGMPPKTPVFAYTRERFDLMRGWVREDQDVGFQGVAHRRVARHQAQRGTRGR